MPKRAALIKEQTVINVILLPDKNADYTPPEDTTMVVLKKDEQCGPGWKVIGDSYEPPELEPETPEIDKQAALDKLAAIGLTVEDLTALGLTL